MSSVSRYPVGTIYIPPLVDSPRTSTCISRSTFVWKIYHQSYNIFSYDIVHPKSLLVLPNTYARTLLNCTSTILKILRETRHGSLCRDFQRLAVLACRMNIERGRQTLASVTVCINVVHSSERCTSSLFTHFRKAGVNPKCFWRHDVILLEFLEVLCALGESTKDTPVFIEIRIYILRIYNLCIEQVAYVDCGVIANICKHPGQSSADRIPARFQ